MSVTRGFAPNLDRTKNEIDFAHFANANDKLMQTAEGANNSHSAF